MVISPLNYAGNKAKVLGQLLELFPENIAVFYDVFCGSALVGANTKAKSIVVNDNSYEVIKLFEYIQKTPTNNILKDMEKNIVKYNLTDSRNKPKNTYIEIKHEGLSKYNKDGFLRMRKDYNASNPRDYSLLFALSIFGFNHYIRFNSKGEYNVPVGKVDFSESLYQKTIAFSDLLKTKEIKVLNLDFRDENLYKNATIEDLFYFDPPYMITNAPYNNNWKETEEEALLSLLDDLNEKGIRFALSNVFYSNGKENTKLIEWSNKYNVHEINRQYRNANYRRKNHSNTKEVLITNY